jgi:cell division protein FtsA
MEGVPELAEAVFDQPVRRGAPAEVGGLADVVRSPIYATGVGLALYGAQRQGTGAPPIDVNDGAMLTRLTRRLAGWFSDIF